MVDRRNETAETISRRAFLAAGSAGLMVGPLLSTLPAEPIPSERPAPGPPVLRPAPRKRLSEIPPELLKQVHPDVRDKRVELPDNHNALFPLRTACKQFRYYHTFISEPPYNLDWATEPPFHKEYEAFEKGGPFPTGKSGDAIRNWIVANQAVVDLTDEAIVRGRLQLSVDHMLNWLDDLWTEKDPLRSLHAVTRYRKVRARLFVVDGELQSGLTEINQILRLGKVVAEADALLIHRIHGQGVQRRGLELIGDLARGGGLPDPVLAKLIHELPQHELSTQSLQQMCRLEFCYCELAALERLPAAPLQELIDSYLLYHMYYSPTIDTLKLLGVTDDDIRDVRRELMAILEDHPLPVEKLETARVTSELVAQCIRDLDRPYIERRRDIAKPLVKEIAAWPSHLCWSEAPSSSLPQDKARVPMSDAQLDAARKALGQVNNPLGKKFATESIKNEFDLPHNLLAGHYAWFAATRILLACRRKLDRDGKLPERLEELAEDKYLEKMPIDPFSNQPFRYSRERALLWSVGDDGKDDNGDWNFEAQFPAGKDLVWRLPQVKAK